MNLTPSQRRSLRRFGRVLKQRRMAKETFRQFITRPSGFGKTPWILFYIISVLCAVLVAVSGYNYWRGDAYPWVAGAFGVGIYGLLWFGTWMNYTGRWV